MLASILTMDKRGLVIIRSVTGTHYVSSPLTPQITQVASQSEFTKLWHHFRPTKHDTKNYFFKAHLSHRRWYPVRSTQRICAAKPAVSVFVNSENFFRSSNFWITFLISDRIRCYHVLIWYRGSIYKSGVHKPTNTFCTFAIIYYLF